MKRFCLLVLMLASVCISALAQAGAPQSSTKPATSLVVEIRNQKNRPSYIPGTGGVWFARFETLRGWQPPADFLPVLAVDFSSQVVNEATLRITVSLHRGVRLHEQQTPVAVYVVSEGETRVAAELKAFGVAPIEFRVVRLRPREEHAPPYFESPTNALELVYIERRETPFPEYTARVRNLSGKDIAAFRLNYFNTRGERATAVPQHPQNETLIKAGEVYELDLRTVGSGEMTPEGYAPDMLQKVSIPTVLFTDGTFAGDLQPAAEMLALSHGRKMQLTRALALVQNALQSPEGNESAGVAEFKARVSALGEEVEPPMVENLTTRFPALKTIEPRTLSAGISYNLQRVKLDLLKSVKEFADAPAGSPAKLSFRQWLASRKETYEQWIARL
ncbi:MAG TPA: hypothetical protein VGO96_15550 [Pyrinomonadaceae bacterium]|jgi:hypothetical protein|nr:hypothetical protein [Pyrinomonadaceae bacterium]